MWAFGALISAQIHTDPMPRSTGLREVMAVVTVDSRGLLCAEACEHSCLLAAV